MSYGRYHRQNLEQFLLHRVTRNVLIQHQAADSTHALICLLGSNVQSLV